MHKPSIRFSKKQQASLDDVTEKLSEWNDGLTNKYNSPIRFSRKHKFVVLTNGDMGGYGPENQTHVSKLSMGKTNSKWYQNISVETFDEVKKDTPRKTANKMLQIGKYQGGAIQELDLPLEVTIRNNGEFIADLENAISEMTAEDKLSIVDYFAALTPERSSYQLQTLVDGEEETVSVDYWTTGITLGFGNNTVTMAFEYDAPLDGFHITTDGDFEEYKVVFSLAE